MPLTGHQPGLFDLMHSGESIPQAVVVY